MLTGCVGENAPPADTPAVVTITFAAQNGERSLYEPLIAQFNEQHTDIQVQFVSLDAASSQDTSQSFDPYQRLREAMSAADTASLWFLSPNDISTGYFRDLKPLMDADATFDPRDFYANALDTYREGDRVYLMPSTLTIPLLSYNKDLWNSHGLPPPDGAWTWQDFVQTAERLAEVSNTPSNEQYGFADQNSDVIAILSELMTADATFFDTPLARIRLDQPAVAQTLDRVATLMNSGAMYLPPMSEESSIQGGQPPILDQRVGMWPRLSLSTLTSNQQPPFEVSTAPLPQSLLVPFNGHVQPSGYVMSNGSQHPQEAWQWLHFLSQQPTHQPGTMVTMPARRSVAEQSEFWNSLDQETASAVQITLDRPYTPPPDELVLWYVGDQLRHALHDMLEHGQSSEQALRVAQTDWEAVLHTLQQHPTPIPDPQPLVVATPLPQVVADRDAQIIFAVPFNSDQWEQLVTTFNASQQESFVQLQANQGPIGTTSTADCFLDFGPPTQDAIPQLLDLQPLIDADSTFPIDEYPDVFLTPLRPNGTLLGLPITVRLRALAYNPTLFDAAQLPYPSTTTTLDEFLFMTQQLTISNGAQQYGFVGATPLDVFFFLDQQGARTLKAQGGVLEPNFTDPDVIAAVRAYLDVLQTASPHQRLEGYMPETESDLDIQQLKRQGQVGVWFQFDPRVPFDTTADATTGENQIALAPPPVDSGGVGPNDMQVELALYIAQHTRHPQDCWAFLKYLANEASLLQGSYPARMTLINTDAFQYERVSGAEDVYQTYTQDVDDHNTQATTGAFDRAPIDYFWFFQAIDRAIQGGDLEQELTEAQQITEQFVVCIQDGTNEDACRIQVDADYRGWNGTLER
ncbi:MAG: extracellular solute-binding protein [Blastochloris sp.]|nr:extracellular solute-binding protein [Blastochloris sp.]